ncbi:MAG: ABC transporter substrate-binding protein [Deltaproteobacteria bacterium]|jgi:phospholipid transport system substrate-binding protein|nr:ABC transporter substrate-binding protein [Deltaproteobacteria bacterium]
MRKILAIYLTIFVGWVVVFNFNHVIAQENATPLVRVQEVITVCKAYILENKGHVAETEMISKLKELVAPVFDFREMAKRCLGNNWNAGTPEQQKEFVDLFSEMLANAYMKKVVNGIGNAEIKYPADSVVSDNKKATVKTIIISDGESINVAYRMLQRKDGSWWVYDVIIENIGLISNYRSEFNEIIRKSGYTGLIQILKDRIEKLKTAAAKAG